MGAVFRDPAPGGLHCPQESSQPWACRSIRSQGAWMEARGLRGVCSLES